MTLTLTENDFLTRFVSCARGAGLLKIRSRVARRAMDGEAGSILPAGLRFTDDFRPAVINEINLTRRGIFRGKIPRRKTQTKKNRLKERTLPAPNP
jgi:hypothetical protein